MPWTPLPSVYCRKGCKGEKTFYVTKNKSTFEVELKLGSAFFSGRIRKCHKQAKHQGEALKSERGW